MTALHYQEITTVSAPITRRQVSPVELTQAFLDRIERLDGKLGSYVCITGEAALESASQAEREIAEGGWRGPGPSRLFLRLRESSRYRNEADMAEIYA
jgi:Asp-tRNA(Asn)/Glu-tRNA(Gln) amidotransferase A subunit family amidase